MRTNDFLGQVRAHLHDYPNRPQHTPEFVAWDLKTHQMICLAEREGEQTALDYLRGHRDSLGYFPYFDIPTDMGGAQGAFYLWKEFAPFVRPTPGMLWTGEEKGSQPRGVNGWKVPPTLLWYRHWGRDDLRFDKQLPTNELGSVCSTSPGQLNQILRNYWNGFMGRLSMAIPGADGVRTAGLTLMRKRIADPLFRVAVNKPCPECWGDGACGACHSSNNMAGYIGHKEKGPHANWDIPFFGLFVDLFSKQPEWSISKEEWESLGWEDARRKSETEEEAEVIEQEETLAGRPMLVLQPKHPDEMKRTGQRCLVLPEDWDYTHAIPPRFCPKDPKTREEGPIYRMGLI